MQAPIQTLAGDTRKDSLIEYPCDFPIKVMGKTHPEFSATIISVVQQYDATFTAERVELRGSSGGNYIGLTVNVRAISREQLDALYQALSSHPMVKVVL